MRSRLIFRMFLYAAVFAFSLFSSTAFAEILPIPSPGYAVYGHVGLIGYSQVGSAPAERFYAPYGLDSWDFSHTYDTGFQHHSIGEIDGCVPGPGVTCDQTGATGRAAASADYGRLGVYVHAWSKFLDQNQLGYTQVNAAAGFSDMWTITGPQGSGGYEGQLAIQYAISGGWNLDNLPNNYLALHYQITAGPGADGMRTISRGAGGPPDTVSVVYPFIFGEAFPVSLEFEMSANTDYEWRLNESEPNMLAEGDYLHTVSLTGIDVDGLDVNEWSLATQSGHNYLGGQPVPVPATVLLLAPGLLGLVGIRRRLGK